MLGVFVRFRCGETFDEAAVRRIAEAARGRFEKLPALRLKAFTFDRSTREAVNFYVWDSEKAASAFFSDERLDHVAGLYGVRPSVEFVEVAVLVDNDRP